MSRQFWLASLADSAGLENWDMWSLWWTNAPGNDVNSGYLFDYTKCYAGTNIWQANGGGIDVSRPELGADYDQAAIYISPEFKDVLASDTDGLVTFMWSGSPNNNNQAWWVGIGGTWTNEPIHAGTGLPCRASPTLELVFDVRVALTGGGRICPGGAGAEVYLAGTDVGCDYYLLTNGVFAGQVVSGTGEAVSFGLQNVPAVYTAIESNTVTSVTRLLPGSAVVVVYEAPVITRQPAPAVAATNSVAIFSVAAVGEDLSYRWYRDGVALSDDNHYWGTTTTQLMINPVLASDAGQYYCVVQNPCGSVVTSTTNTLTVQPARDLAWWGVPTNSWDIATSANWSNRVSGTLSAFYQGDNVTLDNNAQNTAVILASPYLSPGTITFNHDAQMGIGGPGNIYGPNSSLLVAGPTMSSCLVISNANSFGGGTIISNGWLMLRNYKGAGTGTITLAGTGSSLLEIVPAGDAATGLPGIHVAEDSTLQFDGSGAYACCAMGPITGVAGKTLTLQRPAGVASDNFRVYHTNFSCDANIYLNIGSANFAPYNGTGTQIYKGVISGSGVFFTRHGGGTVILNGANTYSGGTRLSLGTTGIGIDSVGVDYGVTSGPFGTGPVTIESGTGTVAIFASGGPRTLGNFFQYASGQCQTLRITGTNLLTLSGTHDLGTGGITTPTNRTIEVDADAGCILAGVLTDSSSLGCGLRKTGAGRLWLDANNTYTGTTIVDGGVLGGTGTIAGPVVVNTNGALGGGSANAIGTLTINNNVTFSGGGVFVRVNKSLPQPNDRVAVSGSLANSGAGTVTVTNLGPALQPGDRFVLFPGKTVLGGNALAVTGAGMLWTNKLEVDGSIEVLAVAPPPVNPNPTNITFSVVGTTLTLSWPESHIGWSLQVQTNTLNVGLSTNWVTIGYENTNRAVLTIDPNAPTVFYRLTYRVP